MPKNIIIFSDGTGQAGGIKFDEPEQFTRFLVPIAVPVISDKDTTS
jgi:hypothetical protein